MKQDPHILIYVHGSHYSDSAPLVSAIGGAVGSIPEWTAAFGANSIGGVTTKMLTASVGGFGRFVAVILAFSVLGNMVGSMYSLSVQFQVLLPVLARVPRFAFTMIITAVVIAVAIPISHKFEESLENFLSIISYWVSIFVGIVSTEHLYFRNGNAASYDHAIWNVGSKLPLGIAAVAASLLPFALIVPCMSNSWYTGPIAEQTGDIGFEVGFVLSIAFYIPFITLERRMTGR
jgi:purine-cytosine permease-like protein